MRILALALACAAVAGCGGSTAGSPPPAPSTTQTTTNPHMPVPPIALTVFRIGGGVLRPSVVHVPRTQAVATAALRALGIDAGVRIAGGTATVEVAQATDAQVAEIVYTLTQFGSVQRVDVAGRTGLTRDDYEAYEPAIVVVAPAASATLPGTFTVSGSASVFEATLVVQLVRDGRVLEQKTVTATAGAPDRGTFATTLDGTAGDATVEAFAPSAEDGSPQHEVDVPVTIGP